MFRRISLLLACRPSEAYRNLAAKGEITSDENQIRALPVFDRLYDDLCKYVADAKRNPPPPRKIELRPPNRQGIIPSFFTRRLQEEKVEKAVSDDGSANYHPLSKVKGLYVYGGVGCGKTMLMDLLYANAPPEIKKLRIHFHQFMLDVLRTSHEIRFKTKEEMESRRNMVSYNTSPERRRTPEAEIDLYDELTQRMLTNVELLCFDEVVVSDVAHAMILKRLFNAFYKMGVVVIFTSNREPSALYPGGLNRGGFLPFIDLVEKQCVVYSMDSNIDHRLAGHATDAYLSPINKENTDKFDKLFLDFSKGLPPTERKLQVFGREVIVPKASGGVCYFFFSEICGANTSTADFEIIAKTFHTVFINGVPRFPYENNDVKNRFLLLIDNLYEFRCKVIILAAVEPALLQETKEESRKLEGGRFDQLTEFERESGKKLADDNSFQMERCISRLYEMRTSEYVQEPHRFVEVNVSTD